MYKINKDDMRLIVNGASFLASGGGGGVDSANDVIKNIIAFSSEVQVAEYDDINDEGDLLVICGVGAPNAPDLNFENSPTYGLEGLQEITGKKYTYVLPIEVGAMNSMIPLLACADLDIPFVDGDGAGRSVPQMNMCTYALKKIATDETLVVSEEDDKFPIHPQNAARMEAEVRDIVSTKLNDAGTVATWSMTGGQVKSDGTMVRGTLGLAKNVGIAMAGTNPVDDVKKVIDGFYGENRIIIREGEVITASSELEDGFDVGVITVRDKKNSNVTIHLYFVNETLLAVIDYYCKPFCFMMGPDMICSMRPDGSPITNSEIYTSYKNGESVDVTLMWVEAVKEIRAPSMFFLYAKLIQEKFGTNFHTKYTFVDAVIDEFVE